MGFGRARLDPHRPAETSHRPFELLELGVGHAQVDPVGGVAAVESDGLFQPLDGRLRIVPPEGQATQPVQGLAVVRLGLLDAAIALFGPGPVAGLEAGPRPEQFGRNVGWRHAIFHTLGLCHRPVTPASRVRSKNSRLVSCYLSRLCLARVVLGIKAARYQLHQRA